MSGHIDDEVDDDRLLMPLIPVFEDVLLVLLQLVQSAAEKETSDVIIIVWRGKSLDGQQVFLDPLKLLLGGCSFVLADQRRFVDFLTLLKVGLWIELFEDVDDSVFAGAADGLLRLFGVLREDADVCRVLLGTSVVLP